MKGNKEPILQIIIRNRQEIQFDDIVHAITSVNETGIFDILPNHANFISIVKDTIVIHKKDNKKEEIKITRGIVRVSENKVNIYLGVFSENPPKP